MASPQRPRQPCGSPPRPAIPIRGLLVAEPYVGVKIKLSASWIVAASIPVLTMIALLSPSFFTSCFPTRRDQQFPMLQSPHADALRTMGPLTRKTNGVVAAAFCIHGDWMGDGGGQLNFEPRWPWPFAGLGAAPCYQCPLARNDIKPAGRLTLVTFIWLAVLFCVERPVLNELGFMG